MAEWEDWSLMDAILSQDIQRALAALESAEGIQLEAAADFFSRKITGTAGFGDVKKGIQKWSKSLIVVELYTQYMHKGIVKGVWATIDLMNFIEWLMVSNIIYFQPYRRWTKKANPIMQNLAPIPPNSMRWLYGCVGFDDPQWHVNHLVMTNIKPWYRWPIEIDGWPF